MRWRPGAGGRRWSSATARRSRECPTPCAAEDDWRMLTQPPVNTDPRPLGRSLGRQARQRLCTRDGASDRARGRAAAGRGVPPGLLSHHAQRAPVLLGGLPDRGALHLPARGPPLGGGPLGGASEQHPARDPQGTQARRDSRRPGAGSLPRGLDEDVLATGPRADALPRRAGAPGHGLREPRGTGDALRGGRGRPRALRELRDPGTTAPPTTCSAAATRSCAPAVQPAC